MTRASQTDQNSASDNRYDGGTAKLRKVDGHTGARVIESLADIAPLLCTLPEVVMQMAVYAGSPAALHRLCAAKDVFSRHAPRARQLALAKYPIVRALIFTGANTAYFRASTEAEPTLRVSEF